METEYHTLTMLVENEPGVTARVSGLFASRNYNIETICGAPTANPRMSRITITTRANPDQLEQIMKQLRRLVNVIKVRDMTGEKSVRREMALICVKAAPADRPEIRSIVATFRGRIVDTGHQRPRDLALELPDSPLSPVMAAARLPYPANSASGPVCPIRQVLSMMMSGLIALSES